MRKVELSLKEKQKYEIIKKLIETNGNKERARIKLGLKSIRQVNRLIAGYKDFGKGFYCTTIKKQAEFMAERVVKRQGRNKNCKYI